MRHQEVSWEEFSSKKIQESPLLASTLSALRQKGFTIATLNGSFDLLHPGHLYIIYEASKVADILVLALNTDDSIKRYKGPDRPILELEKRMQMVSGLALYPE